MCNTECRKNATNPTFDVPKFGCLERPGHCDRQLFYGHQARPGSLSESRAKIPSAISLFHSWIPAESVTRSNSQQITTWFELFELFAPCSQHESSLGERFIAQHMAGWLEPCDQMAGMIILAQLDSSTRRLVIFNFTRESSPGPHLWTWRLSTKSPRCSRGIRKLAPSVRLAEHFCAMQMAEVAEGSV